MQYIKNINEPLSCLKSNKQAQENQLKNFTKKKEVMILNSNQERKRYF